ncbi:hypothetical protein L1887_20686 [Cichorium endivia]|nr:hypothetical protein L1887_20686 [Cichorium endivia]
MRSQISGYPSAKNTLKTKEGHICHLNKGRGQIRQKPIPLHSPSPLLCLSFSLYRPSSHNLYTKSLLCFFQIIHTYLINVFHSSYLLIFEETRLFSSEF